MVIIVKPISNDKRESIIAAKQRNEPVEQIKKWLGLSNSTISRVWNKYLKTGSYEPIPYTGRKSDISPEKDFERSSIIAALGINGINAPMMFEGTLNSDVFRVYVEQILAPSLDAGDIVIMDNYSVHKVEGILEPI